MKPKEWYKSKTLWFNGLTLVVVVATGFGFATFQPDPEIQAVGLGIVAAVNLALRALATSQPVTFK